MKSRWPDGSVRFAVVSGLCDLTAGSERTLSLSAVTPTAGAAAVSLADFRATNAQASIGYGSYGTASWSGTDWDTPARTWSESPSMSSWLYRKPIGTDAHLVAWLEVRVFRGGAVEFVPWIENGYLRVAGPGARSGVATFTLAGSQRFSQSLSLANHQRAVLASGQVYAHWLGTDPQLSVRHDTAYLQNTRLVPTYRATVSSGSSLLTQAVVNYTPLAQGGLPNTMGAAGYHPSIGLLPEWDVVYLASNGDRRAWQQVQVQGYAAGRYGTHHRDETTQRPLVLGSYTNLVLNNGGGNGVTSVGASTTGSYTPTPSGATPPSYASSHAPALGYMAYTLTGRVYFLEEVQFQATLNLLKIGDAVRHFGNGYIPSSVGATTLRGAAWAFRTLAMAAVASPTDDPVGISLRSVVDYNIDTYHARYIAQAHNPQGWVEPYGSNNEPADPYTSAMWQYDFWTASWGLLKDVAANSPARQAKLDALCEFYYKTIIGRLGPSGAGFFGYPYAAQYTMPVAPSNNTDWSGGTGPWYSNFGAIARAINLPSTFASNAPLESPIASGYWANLQPAIAYAVNHGAAGAVEAYNRMTGASNWSSFANSFNSEPVWSVKPRGM